jgi:regulatory protein
MDARHPKTLKREILDGLGPDKCHVEIARSRPFGVKRFAFLIVMAAHGTAAEHGRAAGRDMLGEHTAKLFKTAAVAAKGEPYSIRAFFFVGQLRIAFALGLNISHTRVISIAMRRTRNPGRNAGRSNSDALSEERVFDPADPIDLEKRRAKTLDRAVRLLAAKPRSVKELRERLLEKLWTNGSIVEEVLEKLKDYKYLDDEQYANDLAVSKLRQKPQGKYRLRRTMSQKKLDKETVDAAIENAFEKLPEEDLIDQAIERRLRLKGKPTNRDEAKKFYDHLMRRGFGYDLIRGKMSAIMSREFEDSDP